MKNVFFKLMNNLVFGKTMKNVRQHTEVKLFTTESRRNHLEQINHLTTKFFTKKKTQTLMNKAVYLGLLILQLSKILIYELSYDYVKPKYGEKPK